MTVADTLISNVKSCQPLAFYLVQCHERTHDERNFVTSSGLRNFTCVEVLGFTGVQVAGLCDDRRRDVVADERERGAVRRFLPLRLRVFHHRCHRSAERGSLFHTR